MTQNLTFPVVTSDANGKLRSELFASRPDLVTRVKPLDYEADRQADPRQQPDLRGTVVKVTISGELQSGDFVVRSVVNGNRRKFEVLAGVVPVALLAQCPVADIAENKYFDWKNVVADDSYTPTCPIDAFTAGSKTDVIYLDGGDSVVPFPGAVRIS